MLMEVIRCLNSFKDTTIKIKNMEGEDIPMEERGNSSRVNDHEDEINETSTSADRDEESDRTRL